MSSQVEEGVVAFFEFEEVTDLPEQRDVRQREQTLLLTVEADGAAGAELGRAGPFRLERQRDGHLFRANCQGTQAVLPVLHGGSDASQSKLVVVLWYFKDNGEAEPVGCTEPFAVAWDLQPSMQHAVVKPQIRHYHIAPFNRSLGKDYALTRIHMAHKLIREKRINGTSTHHGQVHMTGRAAGQGPNATTRAVALLQLDMVTDLPGQRRGYYDNARLQDVVITVELVNNLAQAAPMTAGHFPTEVQPGTHFRQADLRRSQLHVPLPAHSQEASIRVLVWNSSETGQLELVSVSDPISITTENIKERYYPLRSQSGGASKGKLYMSHHLIPDVDAVQGRSLSHSSNSRSDFQDRLIAYLKFDRVSDLPSHRHGRRADGGSEGRVILTVEPHGSHEDDGAELGKAGPFQALAQAGGYLNKASCRDAVVTVEGQMSVCIRAWYLTPTAGINGSSDMDLIGTTGPIDLSGQSSPVHCVDLHSNSRTAGRIYLSHLLRPSRVAPQGTGLGGPTWLSTSVSTLGHWPQFVARHLETPQDLEEKWAKDGSTAVPKTKELRLVAGAWQIKHPLSHSGALESLFICKHGSAVGVGEIFDHQTHLPAEAAKVMMRAAENSCERSRVQLRTSAADRAARALEAGGDSTENVATCAGLVAALDAQGKELGVARLGETVLWQIRKVPGSPTTGAHATLVGQAGDPHRPSSHPLHDGPARAELYTWSVQEGDLLVLGTDGVFDNLFGQEVCELAEWTVSPLDARQSYHEGTETLRGPGLSTEPQRIAAAVAHAAHHRASDKLAATPIASKASRQNGVAQVGGKLDDITVVCAWLARSSI